MKFVILPKSSCNKGYCSCNYNLFCRLVFPSFYYTYSGYGVLAKKNRLALNLISKLLNTIDKRCLNKCNEMLYLALTK